jgi:hypothetical protein
MAESGYFKGDTGSTYYVKPIPIVASPWGDDDIAGTETGTTGWFTFASLDEETSYAVYEQAGGSPADSDEFQASLEPSRTDLVDAPNSTAVTAIQSGLSTFDASSDEVTTDSASRTASQADVSSLATAAALAAVDGIVDAILVDTGTTIPAQINSAQSSIEAACATVTTAQIRTALSGRWTNVSTGDDYDDVTVGATP